MSEQTSEQTGERTEPTLHSEPLPLDSFPSIFEGVPLLRHLSPEDIHCFAGAELVTIDKGQPVSLQGVGQLYFWVQLSGLVRGYKESNGTRVFLAEFKAGDTVGEVPLLTGEPNPTLYTEAAEPTTMVRLPASGFWQLMASCPKVREGVLHDMARRFSMFQAAALHKEKLASLGVLAAGLMHELNNPGAAARRAASQLRENLASMQERAMRILRRPLTQDQFLCMVNLQEQIRNSLINPPPPISSLDLSDREEELSTWLDEAGVEDAWRLGPTFAALGWTGENIHCAQQGFSTETLSDTLHYIEAQVSSFQLVGTIEESIIRVTDLVTAVKKYAYEDKRGHRSIDLRDSIKSTLTILGHKFRAKQLHVETKLDEVPPVSCMSIGLNQVWTNLLDNAIDAAPEGSKITVRLWEEDGMVTVGILDHGPGIPPEHQEHIFQPFYTTKEVGVGTGLGLDIVHRIVVQNFGGTIHFTTEPGRTEFIVRLPAGGPEAACSISQPPASTQD